MSFAYWVLLLILSPLLVGAGLLIAYGLWLGCALIIATLGYLFERVRSKK